ncbi:unnamed protein product [Rotaria magnacalcarata]
MNSTRIDPSILSLTMVRETRKRWLFDIVYYLVLFYSSSCEPSTEFMLITHILLLLCMHSIDKWKTLP